MANASHRIDPVLLTRRVTVHLAGVGGNGAQMAACLARLDIAMRALGHPHGLAVTAFDPDTVSEANVGRQLYSPADVGQCKAVVTMTRLNHFYGLDWEAAPSTIEAYWQNKGQHTRAMADILIGCVDSRAARRAIHMFLFSGERYRYWLDLGNREADAQVVLGQPPSQSSGRAQAGPRLPCVTERYPELLDASMAEDNTPSCSVRVALASQGLFINDIAVRFGAQLLYELFSTGGLTDHGVICNLASKRSAPIQANERS
ncbi:PRTRC system ThiF family protein [Massilia sp. BJB1822]|uniref:PRTRC system ThiF family protein n=1 Tax=Massilia sp. BJB1822 TaxID=2744470 RepID=UPI00159321E3|nr:PRTRC system ThiF family protein [Massilia sp. BJB1822]NVE00681.1 PRTRC system ThiF family protein [Massilia sp. BJB1822]